MASFTSSSFLTSQGTWVTGLDNTESLSLHLTLLRRTLILLLLASSLALKLSVSSLFPSTLSWHSGDLTTFYTTHYFAVNYLFSVNPFVSKILLWIWRKFQISAKSQTEPSHITKNVVILTPLNLSAVSF